MKPRTVCFCQPIVFMISASVAPFFRWSMATTWAVLVPSRGPSALGFADFWGALGAFLAWAVFLGVAAGGALGLPPLAALWPLGAPSLGLAPFFEEGFCGGVGGGCVLGGHLRLISFCGITASRHPSLWCPRKASGFCGILAKAMERRWLQLPEFQAAYRKAVH
jgi:hypothetical protein